MFHTDKAFICETCGKAFRFRSNLAEHRSVHTALKPYVCKFCGKSSRLKGNLTKHILKHHKKEQNEAIAKDDIIVKKAPKIVTKDNGPTTNGSTPTTSTATPSVITVSSALASSNGHNNNNNNHAVNNNLRTIKMELEDPDYNLIAKSAPTPVVSKIVATHTVTPRSRPTPKDIKEILETIAPSVGVSETPEEMCLLPKDASSESDRSVLISLGFDFGSTLSLNHQQLQQVVRELKGELSISPDTVQSDHSDDFEQDSPPPMAIANISTVGGEATLAAMIVAATNASGQRGDGTPDSTDTQKGCSPQRELSPESDPSTSSGDSCPSPPKMLHCKECGTLVRKSSHLPIHMTMSHGYPPPLVAAPVEEKPAPEQPVNASSLHNELRVISNAICELKAQQAATPRVEQALTYIDSRVGKLERSLETALNSIYTLVQLQTGMTSSVNRLREDSTKNFSDLKTRMEMSLSPIKPFQQRFSRERSSSSSVERSPSRERSRSPL